MRGDLLLKSGAWTFAPLRSTSFCRFRFSHECRFLSKSFNEILWQLSIKHLTCSLTCRYLFSRSALKFCPKRWRSRSVCISLIECFLSSFFSFLPTQDPDQLFECLSGVEVQIFTYKYLIRKNFSQKEIVKYLSHLFFNEVQNIRTKIRKNPFIFDFYKLLLLIIYVQFVQPFDSSSSYKKAGLHEAGTHMHYLKNNTWKATL